jgi:hypothetical protein
LLYWLGLGTSILNTKTNTNYMTQTWFHPIKQFLTGINASIQIKHLWYPKNLRQNDIILMDTACQCMISNDNLQTFNNWRIYFQVITLSDITTLDGLKIKEWYLTKKASYKQQSPSLLRWPIQNQPDISTFKVWLSTLKQIVSFGTGGVLKEPLGRWTSNPLLERKINFVTDNTYLYQHQHNNIWSVHTINHHQYRKIYFHKDIIKMTKLRNSETYIPVDTELLKNLYVINLRNTHQIPSSPNKIMRTTNTSLKEHIQYESEWTKEIFQHITTSDEEILMNNQELPIYICCDGGVKDLKAGFGLILQCNNTTIITNKSRIPEVYLPQSSHRAEGFGIICSLVIITKLQEFKYINNKLNQINVNIICDNEAIVNTVKQLRNAKLSLKNYYAPDSDVIITILRLLKQLKELHTTIQFKHIKGHQDRTTTKLSYEAQLNVKANELATDSLVLKKNDNINLPEPKSRLFINNKMITSHNTTTLTQAFHSIRVRQYFTKTYSWPNSLHEQVWWSTKENTKRTADKWGSDIVTLT